MQLLNFDKFVNEKYNPQPKVNESLKSFFSDMLNKVKGWFTGKGSWLKNWKKLKSEFGDGDMFKEVGIDFYDYSTAKVSESKINEAEQKNQRSGVALEHPNPEVPNFSFKEMEDALEMHWYSKKPPFIWGAPGIGKTDVVKQLAKKMGVPLILINLSMRDPVDFIGLPSIEQVQTKDGKTRGRTVYNLPKFFPDDNGPEEKGGIIFFDELNRAAGPVLSASLQLFLDRKIDEYELPSEWLIVAAGNRSVEAPEVSDLGPALSNRVKQYNLVPDVKSWADWADTKKDEKGIAQISPEFINFLISNQAYFHSYANDPNSPWPSPRSWTEAALNYKLIREKNPKKANDADFMKRTLAADVGLDAASAFINFLKLLDKFSDQDCEDVFKNPAKAKMIPLDRADIAYACLLKLAYFKREKGMTPAEFMSLVDYAIRMKSFEYSSALLKNCRQLYPNVFKDKAVVKKLEEWATAHDADAKKLTQ